MMPYDRQGRYYSSRPVNATPPFGMTLDQLAGISPTDDGSYSGCDCIQCQQSRERSMSPEDSERARQERVAAYEAEMIAANERMERARLNQQRARRRRARRRRADIATRGRTFGVELEVHVDTYDVDDHVIANLLQDSGVNCVADGYNHNVVAGQWKVVGDASVDEGWEIVSPPLHWDEREQITTVCNVLDSLGASVERDCGLHVHHDISDLSTAGVKRVCRMWHDAQPLTDRLVSRDRVGTQDFTAPWNEHDMERILSCRTLDDITSAGYDIGRYFALNIQSIERYGTVEVRQHQGTIDADAIIAWVAYGQALVSKAAKTPGRVCNVPERQSLAPTVADLLDSLPIANEFVKDTLKSRIRPARVPATV